MIRTQKEQATITPEKALQTLKEGNQRFVAQEMRPRDLCEEVGATGAAAYPFASILSCMDFRLSSEFIFDQGIGDIFSLRIAGNIVNDDILSCLEYTGVGAGVRLIAVVGHSECAAIKAVCDPHIELERFAQTLSHIEPAIAAVSGFNADRSSSNPAFVQAVAKKNVDLAVEHIRSRSTLLEQMERAGKIAIVGAVYDVHTGAVTFAS